MSLKKFIRFKNPKRNSTMFRCNRFQIKLQIQKPLIVNFKINRFFFPGWHFIPIISDKKALRSRIYLRTESIK